MTWRDSFNEIQEIWKKKAFKRESDGAMVVDEETFKQIQEIINRDTGWESAEKIKAGKKRSSQ